MESKFRLNNTGRHITFSEYYLLHITFCMYGFAIDQFFDIFVNLRRWTPIVTNNFFMFVGNIIR